MSFDKKYDDLKPKYKSFSKVKYLENSQGMTSIVRILDDGRQIDVHYIPNQMGYVECLGGSDCPICTNNRELWMKYDKEASKQPGYFGKSMRTYINVLDLTPVRFCTNPDCKHPVKKVGRNFPDKCPKCSTILPQGVPIVPLNQVRILGAGKKVYDGIVDVNMSVLDADKNAIGVQNYNIKLTCVDKQSTLVQETDPLDTTPVEYNPEEYTDLTADTTAVVMKFSADELTQIMAGVKFKDIFAARRAVESTSKDTGKISDLEKKLEDELADEEMENLFKTE